MKMLPRYLVLFFTCALCSGAVAQTSPQFNHAAFFVHDLKASGDFYRDVVGLRMIPHPFPVPKYAWFSVGPKQALHLIAGAEANVPKDKMNHFSLSVPSLDGFIERLARYKIGYEDAVGAKSAVAHRPDGVNQIYIQDPDGNWLEINDAKE
ncbi:MAG: VOC family protein [Opitutus sp.]